MQSNQQNKGIYLNSLTFRVFEPIFQIPSTIKKKKKKSNDLQSI